MTNPFKVQIAKDIQTAHWHALFFDQALGPAVGGVVNDVSAELADNAITAEDAAQQVKAGGRRQQVAFSRPLPRRAGSLLPSAGSSSSPPCRDDDDEHCSRPEPSDRASSAASGGTWTARA